MALGPSRHRLTLTLNLQTLGHVLPKSTYKLVLGPYKLTNGLDRR